MFTDKVPDHQEDWAKGTDQVYFVLITSLFWVRVFQTHTLHNELKIGLLPQPYSHIGLLIRIKTVLLTSMSSVSYGNWWGGKVTGFQITKLTVNIGKTPETNCLYISETIWFDCHSHDISEEAREALKKFDHDNDGKVTRSELENLLVKYNTIGVKELNALMRFVLIWFYLSAL